MGDLVFLIIDYIVRCRMTVEEKAFSEELMKRIQLAEITCGYQGSRQKASIAQRGGVAVVKRELSRDGCSHGFQLLKEKGELGLTSEALVVDKKYAILFEDEEVNMCLNLLCECGYFG